MTTTDRPFIGCDLGGTRTKIAVVQNGVVLARDTIVSNSEQGLARHLPRIAAAIGGVVDRAGTSLGRCGGIAFALPGLVGRSGTTVTRIPQKWRDATELDIGAWTQRHLGIPATLENDARAAVIGEWHHGAGRDTQNLVMITLGTGIGVGAVVDGRVLRGAHGASAVLGGHRRLEPDGRRCMCGMIGCAEAEASSWALAEIVQELSGPDLPGQTVSYQNLADLAEQDERFGRVWDRSLRVWSALIVDLVHTFDPERVVIGGGIAQNSVIVDALAGALDSDPWTSGWEIPIVGTELGDDAALLAAPWLIDRSAEHPQEKRPT